MLRIALISITIAMLAGCGPDGAPDSVTKQFSSNLYADSVKIAIGVANPGATDEYNVSVSFSQSQTNIKVCEWNGTACALGTELSVGASSTVGNRTIYTTTQYLRIDAAKTYAVSYTETGAAAPTFFKFKFQQAGTTQGGQTVTGTQTPTTEGMTWKGLFVTGDNEFNAWDNARNKLVEMFTARNMRTENIKQLSMMRSQQTGGIGQTSKTNIQSSLQELTNGQTNAQNEACLVFMTSHGSRQGFFLRNQGTISPNEFGGYLDATCGDRPTVAIISACYSGVMINQNTQKPNRIIFTAASKDKTSFGCDASSTYTFFDQCVIETLPKAQDWKTFGQLNTECVRNLEQQRGMPHFSNPQTFIGANVQSLAIPK